VGPWSQYNHTYIYLSILTSLSFISIVVAVCATAISMTGVAVTASNHVVEEVTRWVS
jgi:hypothetical protein